MRFNTRQIGLDWNSWIRDPENKKLYEQNQSEAKKKYLMDEEEYIHELILQERIETERQLKFNNHLKKLTEQAEEVNAVAGLAAVSGIGGVAASGGGGFSNLRTGIENFVIEVYATSELDQVDTARLAGDEGFERFTVR